MRTSRSLIPNSAIARIRLPSQTVPPRGIIESPKTVVISEPAEGSEALRFAVDMSAIGGGDLDWSIHVRKDEHVSAMLERDKETNILINGLQEALTQSLGIESPTRMHLRARGEGDNPASEDHRDAV